MFKRSILIVIALLVLGVMVVAAQDPTEEPTQEPTVEPTVEPTIDITDEPTTEPTVEPTDEATEEPTAVPTTDTGGTGGTGATPEATMEATDSPNVGSGTGIGAFSMGMMVDMMMEQAGANAVLMDADGNTVGQAWFFEFDEDDFNDVTDATDDDDDSDDKVFVVAKVNDLPEGFHGFHIHAVGSCEEADGMPFGAAGGHMNPTGAEHDDHAGDLSTLMVGADGSGYIVTATDRFVMGDLFDDDGSALMVHSNADNHANIPERYGGPDAETLTGGDSGARLACGVIEEGAGTMSTMSGKSTDDGMSATEEATPAG